MYATAAPRISLKISWVGGDGEEIGIRLLVAVIMCPQAGCALRVSGMDAALICSASLQLVWRVLMCRHRSWNDADSSARKPADRAHCHHSSITRRGWLDAKKFNDIRWGATAYTNVLKVLAHSCAVFIGPSGVGKTHLANAIGQLACLRGHRVRFVTAADLVNDLVAAQARNRLHRRLATWASYELLLVDELGYLSFDTRGADLLYQVFNRRYQRAATIVTIDQN